MLWSRQTRHTQSAGSDKFSNNKKKGEEKKQQWGRGREAIVLSTGCQSREATLSVWWVGVEEHCPVVTSHSLMVASAEPEGRAGGGGGEEGGEGMHAWTVTHYGIG